MSHTPDRPPGAQSTNTPLTEGRGSGVWSLDNIFEILSPKVRRHALYVLYSRTEPMAVADLADAVASTCGASPSRITLRLHHAHLPKLAEMGVVEYDRDAGTVVLGDTSPRFDHYLATAADDEFESLRRASECATLSEF